MSGNIWLDVLSAILLILGAAMSLTAGIGLLRFDDIMTRLHSQSKPQSSGLIFLLIALGLQQGKWELVPLLVLVIVFQMLTTPAASIVLARAGYRSRHYDGVDLALDELRDDVQRAERATGVEEERAALAAREAESDNSDHTV
ncbi:monovalent cation/H(+) antiporter subunit G [uncultured Gulosibacter sp.]|uniref:monovalent cation/H(+) antiporter subunit G n=1 Tax=uncultured Gulosibacter sp. TaxID=1339167 RepID=UPI002888FFA8|nr:monovalent cation/H(+) antiporter subunit G [uncultured Gulosibacter sp.]